MDTSNACKFYPECWYVAYPSEEGAAALKEHLRLAHDITKE